jgi:RNA polymerase sigma-70 factor (ECF subfamily)
MPANTEFESLVHLYGGEIYAYLWRILREPQDAEDCLQESFLRAYRAYGRLPEDANCRAWLYKIATNVARTHLKRAAAVAARTSDIDPDRIADHDSAAGEAERREVLQAVHSAVLALPWKQRSAFLMRKYQGLGYGVIADVLDCSPESARAHVYQAMRSLRAKFSKEKNE